MRPDRETEELEGFWTANQTNGAGRAVAALGACREQGFDGGPEGGAVVGA